MYKFPRIFADTQTIEKSAQEDNYTIFHLNSMANRFILRNEAFEILSKYKLS